MQEEFEKMKRMVGQIVKEKYYKKYGKKNI